MTRRNDQRDANFEMEAGGHKQRNVGSLWKMEKSGKQSPREPP